MSKILKVTKNNFDKLGTTGKAHSDDTNNVLKTFDLIYLGVTWLIVREKQIFAHCHRHENSTIRQQNLQNLVSPLITRVKKFCLCTTFLSTLELTRTSLTSINSAEMQVSFFK